MAYRNEPWQRQRGRTRTLADERGALLAPLGANRFGIARAVRARSRSSRLSALELDGCAVIKALRPGSFGAEPSRLSEWSARVRPCPRSSAL